jgi:hypothetical protein
MSSPLLNLLPGASGLPQSIISIQYNGGDVSSIIQPNLLKLIYHDRISYQSDNLEFTIADPNGTFRNEFSFSAGSGLTFGLGAMNWAYPGESLFNNYGAFAITNVSPAQSRSGSTVDIRCSSVPIASSFRLEMKFNRWQAITLHGMATQIASDNQMQLSYQSSTDPLIATIEQTDESDFVFLSRVCQTVGMSMKVRDNTITIFSRAEYEAKPPKGIITFPPTPGLLLSNILNPGAAAGYGVNGQGGMISWTASDNLDGIFKDCRITIRSIDSGKTTIGKFVDTNNPPVGASLNKRTNIYPSNYGPELVGGGGYYDGVGPMTTDADQKARYELRLRAEKRHNLRIQLPFCLKIESGDVWTMQGIGKDFDGLPWIGIETEQTKAGDETGSRTGVTFERCLGW